MSVNRPGSNLMSKKELKHRGIVSVECDGISTDVVWGFDRLQYHLAWRMMSFRHIRRVWLLLMRSRMKAMLVWCKSRRRPQASVDDAWGNGLGRCGQLQLPALPRHNLAFPVRCNKPGAPRPTSHSFTHPQLNSLRVHHLRLINIFHYLEYIMAKHGT